MDGTLSTSLRTLVAYCDSQRRLRFFRRLAGILQMRALFLTSKPSVYFRARAAGLTVRLITRAEHPAFVHPLDRALECVTGELDAVQAERFCAAVTAALDTLVPAPDLVLCWNGGTLVDVPLTAYAGARHIPQLFLEIANIPGRLFVDPQGTGSDALVAREPVHLGAPPPAPDLPEFETWRQQYIAARLARVRLPQQQPIYIERLLAPLDVMASRLLRGARPQRLDPARIRDRLRRTGGRVALLGGTSTAPAAPFDLYGLQVIDDTNVLLRSPVGVLDGLARATQLARQRGHHLALCPHPAERSGAALRAIAQAVEGADDLHILSGNSFGWALRAESVIVLNSTLGLEARLAGRPVTTLGEALYGGWSESDLRNYVQRWLIPLDYHQLAQSNVDIGPVDVRYVRERFADMIALSRSYPAQPRVSPPMVTDGTASCSVG